MYIYIDYHNCLPACVAGSFFAAVAAGAGAGAGAGAVGAGAGAGLSLNHEGVSSSLAIFSDNVSICSEAKSERYYYWYVNCVVGEDKRIEIQCTRL